MPERILIRGEISVWVHVGRALAALATVVGTVAGVVGDSRAWWLAGGGAVIWLWLETIAWRARRVKTWLTLHPDGIEVESQEGHVAIHDSQVSAVALFTKKNLMNGELTSVTRKFTIWAETWPEPILMENRIKVGRSDPLAELIQRLLGRLRTQMESEIVRGGTASGENWHLSRSALTVGRPPLDEQMPLSDVTAVEPREGQMCVWRRGVDEAVARLPLAGRNVCLLPALIKPFLAEGVTARAMDMVSKNTLGRVLFEKRASRSTVMVLWIVSVGLVAFGAALFALFQKNKADDGLLAAGSLLTGIGVLLGLLGIWLGFSVFRCHEKGVWKKTLLGARSLPYEDIGRFQYTAVKHYHHGAYLGTQVTMRFVPEVSGGKVLKYSTRTKGEDDDLERLRDSISRLLAERMVEKFAAGQIVPWTKNTEFTSEGIRYRAIGFVVRKPPQLLPYDDYIRWELSHGKLRLFARGLKKAVMIEPASAENFWPGFYFLQRLLHSSEASTETLAAAQR